MPTKTIRRIKRLATTLAYDSLTLEGGLINPAMLEDVAARKAKHQKEADYAIPKGVTLKDEMARHFRIFQALVREFNQKQTPTGDLTSQLAQSLLRDVLGFHDIRPAGLKTFQGRTYTLSLEALGGRVPVVVVPPTDSLDKASDHLFTDGRKRSAATALQDWLNADDESLWGICTNGETLRLMRDNASLTRPAYLEFDLRLIAEGEKFNDFTLFWLLLHASRFGKPGNPASDCPLEAWREEGSKVGVAARDRLRSGVEEALQVLGTGFLQHPKNTDLRSAISNGELSLQSYFTQLLRLVYRLIFLMVAEDRSLLHAPYTSLETKDLYLKGYSLSHLRDHAIRRAAWDNYHDRWEGLRIVFDCLSKGEPRLGLPALGGLFTKEATPALDTAYLNNRALMEVIYKLGWLKEDSRLIRINWRDMETEELGSVYESLLELTPRLNGDGWRFTFADGLEAKGNARKTTGSYYTPDALVKLLLDSALDPVLDRVEREGSDPVQGLLALNVIDPACGSGHFLLAAARRIADRVARTRAGGVASAADYRHALREVTLHCIYGVDKNPMAVELTKVALWIESVEPGKPLGFLDAHIRCGDSLVGVMNAKQLEDGIPDAAYKALTGDDKKICAALKKANKTGYDKDNQGLQHNLFNATQPKQARLSLTDIERMPEDTLAQIAAKQQAWEATQQAPELLKERYKANLYVAAFFAPKTEETQDWVPTNEDYARAVRDVASRPKVEEAVNQIATEANAFHWYLEFTDVMNRGGFDAVLGNPPWEVMQLGEEEYFAQRLPEISELKGATRKKLLQLWETSSPNCFQTIKKTNDYLKLVMTLPALVIGLP